MREGKRDKKKKKKQQDKGAKMESVDE